MCSAFRSAYVVNKSEYAFVVGIIMLESDFHVDVVSGSLEIKDILVQRSLGSVKILNVLLDTAFVVVFNVFLSLYSLFRIGKGLEGFGSFGFVLAVCSFFCLLDHTVCD